MAQAPPVVGQWIPPSQTVLDRRWWVLGLLCTSLVIVVVGNTSLNVALPTIQRQLGASQTELQWMVDAYSLVFAGLLLTAGAMGDRLGRKGALQGGLVLFGLASLAAGLSNTGGAIIGFRALMGVGAAFVMPATLSILTNVFPPEERAKAIAIWAGLSGAGAGIGPVASGYLLKHFSFGSVFFVNLPIIAFALGMGAWLIPTSRDPEQGRLDPIGALLSIVGLSAVLFSIIEGPDNGWLSARTLGAFAVGAVVLGVFAWWELHTDQPMLNLRYFKNPRLSVASGGIMLVFFAMFGMFFLITQFFQLVLGYSPLSAGVRQVPVALALVLVAPNSARLVARFGAKYVVAAGMALVGTGQLLIAVTSSLHTPYWQICGSMVIVASGMGLTVSPLTAAIMGSMPLGKAGVGSAVNDTTRELGGALGVGVLGSLLAGSYAAGVAKIPGLPLAVRHAAESSLAGALHVAGSGALPSPVANALVTGARQAYVDGMHTALFVGASFAFCAAVLMFKFMPNTTSILAGPARQASRDADHGGDHPDRARPAPAMVRGAVAADGAAAS